MTYFDLLRRHSMHIRLASNHADLAPVYVAAGTSPEAKSDDQESVDVARGLRATRPKLKTLSPLLGTV